MAQGHEENPFARAAVRQQDAKSFSPLKWILAGAGILMLICCGGMFMGLAYIGAVSPETSVYLGNQVPRRYLSTAEELGALEPGEKVRFFYSDGLLDVTEGFYFVTDDKVAIYSSDGRDPALTIVPLLSVVNATLDRDESFFEDSVITLETDGGEFHAFPVSSELGRDQMFFDAIEKQRKE